MEETQPITYIKKGFFQTPQGSFVILLIGILIILSTIFTLNYFRIIHSSLLNSLPKTQTPSSIIVSSQNNTNSPSTEIPIYVINVTDKFLNDNLLPAYHKKLRLKRSTMTVNGQTLELSAFSDKWQVGSTSATFAVNYDFNKKLSSGANLSLNIPNNNPSPNNKTISNLIADFIKPSSKLPLSDLKCSDPNKIGNFECNAMKQLPDETRLGVSFSGNTLDKNIQDIITMCWLFTSSQNFAWNSCLHP